MRGLTVVLANGDVIDLGGRAPASGGRTRPDPLFVGSEGTLGVITEATLVDAPRRHVRGDARPTASTPSTTGSRPAGGSSSATRGPRCCASTTRPSRSGNFDVDACALIVLDEGDDASRRRHDGRRRRGVRGAATARRRARRDVARAPQRRRRAGAAVGARHRRRHDRGRRRRGRRSPRCTERVTAALRDCPRHRSSRRCTSPTPTSTARACTSPSPGDPTGDPTAFYRAAWDAATDAVLRRRRRPQPPPRRRPQPRPLRRRRAGQRLRPARGAQGDCSTPHDMLNPGVLGLGGAAVVRALAIDVGTTSVRTAHRRRPRARHARAPAAPQRRDARIPARSNSTPPRSPASRSISRDARSPTAGAATSWASPTSARRPSSSTRRRASRSDRRSAGRTCAP